MSDTHFLIVITQRIVFNDSTGTVLKTYEVGDVIRATCDAGQYFVHSMGGIYHDEARRLTNDESISYAHASGNANHRFVQSASDPLPVWAVNIRLVA